MADDPQPTSAPLAEISHGPGAFELFLDRNQKSLIVLLILIILGVAGFVVFQGIQDGVRTTAANALYRASDTAALRKVTEEHAKTPAGATARILLAESLWNDGQQEASIEAINSFLASSPKHPGVPAAKASLAAKKMAQGKSAEATAAFQDIVDDPTSSYLAPYALLCLGDISASAGDKNQAKKFYDQAQSQFPNSGFNQKITQRIASLNSTPPTEIDPPPAPPEPTTTPSSPSFPIPFAPDSILPNGSIAPQPSPSTPSPDPPDSQPAETQPSPSQDEPS